MTWQSSGVGLADARVDGNELFCFVGFATSQSLQRLDLPANVSGKLLMVGKQRFQRVRRIPFTVHKVDILPQRKTVQIVDDCSTTQVTLLFGDLQQAGSRKNHYSIPAWNRRPILHEPTSQGICGFHPGKGLLRPAGEAPGRIQTGCELENKGYQPRPTWPCY